MDDEMQTFRQKTGRKSGCHGCKYADWDADGATCKLDGLNVLNASKGCKYRKEKAVTNGDKIRSMTDEQLAEFLHRIIRCCTNESCQGNKCPLYGACGQRIEQQKKWLKKEAEP
jgi:hypothetical protein